VNGATVYSYKTDLELERLYLESDFIELNKEGQEVVPVSIDISLARSYEEHAVRLPSENRQNTTSGG
jgi:hypothetical protein